MGTTAYDKGRISVLVKLIAEWFGGDPERFVDAKHGIQIEITAIKPTRSTEANARYWVIVTALASHVGYTKGEMHEEVLADMHGYELIEFRGSVKKKPKGRSHNLTTTDFSDLMAIAERWCTEMSVTWEEVA